MSPAGRLRPAARCRHRPGPRDAALGTLALMVGGMILAHATNGTPLSGEVLESASRYGAAALRALEEQA